MANSDPMSQTDLLAYIGDTLWPAFNAERKRLDRIDKWYRWDHEQPHAPNRATAESRQLAERSQAPWGGLVVTAVAQALYVDGYRASKENDNAAPWSWWQANGLDKHQIAVHRAALAYGIAYTTTMPGTSQMLDEAMPVIRGHSPRRFFAMYDEPAYDDFPHIAMEADDVKIDGNPGWALRVYDADYVYFVRCGAGGDGLQYIEWREHGIGVCPVVRFTNMLDLEARADGEIEPIIPMLARIDQTVFDRLVVQRYGSWVVRTISGMAKPEGMNDDQWEAFRERAKLALTVDSILVNESPDAKFGSLPATPLEGFIAANEADIRQLAAASQTPAHEMLGQMANLSAEALAAARASLTAKVDERKVTFGDSWERNLRLAGHAMGDIAAAADFSAEVRWRDTELRSIGQAADALGKYAQMLGVPVELLWEKIPGWTDQDVERAKQLANSPDSLQGLMSQLVAATTAPGPAPAPPG